MAKAEGRGDAGKGRAEDGDSPLLALLPHALRLLRREPALGITVAYALTALAGIFYATSFYRQFDIPILSLLQVGDFLIAGIQQPVALSLVLSTLPLCWWMDRWNMRVFRRQLAAQERLRGLESLTFAQRLRLRYLDWHVPEVRRGTTLQVSYVLVVLLWGSLFVTWFAQFRAVKVKAGEAARVTVWLNGEAAPLPASQSSTWTWLGAAGSYVFVYDRDAGRAQVLPASAVRRLEPVPRARKPGKLAQKLGLAPKA